MKNKLNCGCCEDESPRTCLICGNCPQIAEDDKRIVAVEHPDKDLPGFFSNGRVTGEFALFTEEGIFDVLLDYADDLNVYVVRIQLDPLVSSNVQAIIQIIVVVGGIETIIAERVFISPTPIDFTTHTGLFCITWEPGDIRASLIWGSAGSQVTLRASKSLDFYSGRVGTQYHAASGSIKGYYRQPGDVTDEGICPDCPDYVAGLPCTCCPSGIAASWQVDLTGMSLTNGSWTACDQLDGTYILDRSTTSPCLVAYRERYPVSYFDDGCNAALIDADIVFQLTVTSTAGGCMVIFTMAIIANSPSQTCRFAGVFGIFQQLIEPGNEPCEGTFVLDKTYEKFGTTLGYPCYGTLPATITVTSL